MKKLLWPLLLVSASCFAQAVGGHGVPGTTTLAPLTGAQVIALFAGVSGCSTSSNYLTPASGTCVAPGSAPVSSVANSDGTLTVTPTTGVVVASLNLGHANTWTGLPSFNGGANLAGTVNMTGNMFVSGFLYNDAFDTGTICHSGASPAVCASAVTGSVAVPAGTGSTLTVNTTLVTANSQIHLTVDASAPVTSTTCNTTLATLTGTPLAVTARTAGTSFTISTAASSTILTNPLCVDYTIFN